MADASPRLETQSHRFEALDGLRGIAAVLVMLFHYCVNADGGGGFAGYLAVDFFLVLSGFVISHAYYSKPLNFRAFVRNRLARMWPMHAAIIIVLASALLVVKGDLDLGALIMKLTLTNNLGFGPDKYVYNVPSWTVAVELWINVLVGLLFVAVPAIRRSLLSLSVVCGVIAFACYAALFVTPGHLDTVEDDFLPGLNTGFIRCLGAFCLGLVVHRVYVLFGERLRTRLGIWSGSVISLVFLALLLNPMEETAWDFASVIVFPVVVFYFSTARNLITRIPAALTYLGKISFSLYLVHWPAMEVLTLLSDALGIDLTMAQPANLVLVNVLAITGSLAAAMVLNRYFEDPVYRLLRQPHATKPAPAVTEDAPDDGPAPRPA